MPKIRPNTAILYHSKMQSGRRHGSQFNALMSSYKPFLWWKLNDTPGSGIIADYGNVAGAPAFPQGPPHPGVYPLHNTQTANAFTTDGQPATQWDGIHQSQGAYTGPATDDLPQGTQWTFLIASRVPLGTAAQQTIFSMCAGLGLDVDGKAVFTFALAPSGAGTALIQVDYQGGAEAHAILHDARFTDGQWHLYAINVYSPVAQLQAVMNYDLYIDGAFVSQTQLNSGGLSVFYGGGNFASLPDAFRVGGYPAWASVVSQSVGASQHFAVFIGGALAAFGPMLTAQKILALYNGR